MVGHKVDDRFHALCVNAVDQRLEFLFALRRIVGVVGRNIEVIADGIRAAGAPLEQVGVIRRLTHRRMVRGRGLLQHASQPKMREAHAFDLGKGRVVDVAEFSHAVLFHRPAGSPRLVGVAEESGQELINADPRSLRRRAPGAAKGGGAIFRAHGEIVADGALASAGSGGAINRPVKPPASILDSEVFEVDDDAVRRAKQFGRNAHTDLGWLGRNGHVLRILAWTPRSFGPAAQGDFFAPCRAPCRDEQIGGKRQPDRRALLARIRGHQRRTLSRGFPQSDEYRLLRAIDPGTEHPDFQRFRRAGQDIPDLVGPEGIVASRRSMRPGDSKKGKKQNSEPGHMNINQNRRAIACQGTVVRACRRGTEGICWT